MSRKSFVIAVFVAATVACLYADANGGWRRRCQPSCQPSCVPYTMNEPPQVLALYKCVKVGKDLVWQWVAFCRNEDLLKRHAETVHGADAKLILDMKHIKVDPNYLIALPECPEEKKPSKAEEGDFAIGYFGSLDGKSCDKTKRQPAMLGG